MKKIIDLLLVLIVLMMGIGGGFLYREGMGYVDYALRRGNSKDPWGPPQAFEEIYPYPNKDPPVSYTHLDVYKRQGQRAGFA